MATVNKSSDLRLAGWSRTIEIGADEKVPVLYTVDGLPISDNCFIGYAGMADGKRKWYIHWYRDGHRLDSPTGAYDSPENALEAFREFISTL
jgi:hypothetical protein